MNHEPVGPLKVGQMVVIIDAKEMSQLCGRIGTVVRGPTLDFTAVSGVTGEPKLVKGISYGVHIPDTEHLGFHKKGRWCCRRHQLLPLDDPGDTHALFRDEVMKHERST